MRPTHVTTCPPDGISAFRGPSDLGVCPWLPAVAAPQRTRKTIGARRTPLARSTAAQGPRDRAATTTDEHQPDSTPPDRPTVVRSVDANPHRDKVPSAQSRPATCCASPATRSTRSPRRRRSRWSARRRRPGASAGPSSRTLIASPSGGTVHRSTRRTESPEGVCAQSELCALGLTADRAYKSPDSCVGPTRESTAHRRSDL